MADAVWYYLLNDKQHGPVTSSVLKALANDGTIGPADLVWREGMQDWTEAGRIKGLCPSAPVLDEIEYGYQPAPPRRKQRRESDEYAPQSDATTGDDVAPYGYAGFWKRVAAVILDAFILAFVGGIFGCIIGGALGAAGHGRDNTVQLAIQTTMFIVRWLYFALMESSEYQGTLGKQALGIKVTDLNGDPISFGRATGRYFAAILSLLTFWIGYIMAGVTERKQALHDMIAGTLVVNG